MTVIVLISKVFQLRISIFNLIMLSQTGLMNKNEACSVACKGQVMMEEHQQLIDLSLQMQPSLAEEKEWENLDYRAQVI